MALACTPKVSKFFRCISLLFMLFIMSISEQSFAQTQTVVTTTGAGSFTVPAGVTEVTVRVIGGGGGAGRANTGFSAGAGGGGGYASKKFTGLTGGTSVIYYSVGTAGTGSAVNATAGTAGGDSWANTSNAAPTTNSGALAKGGSGGLASATANSAGGAGGILGYGDTAKVGGNGGTGTSTGAAGGAAGYALQSAAPSASGTTAGVGSLFSGSGGAAGTVGGNYGGGGGATFGKVSGASGAQGVIIINYTLPVCSGTPAPGNTIASVNPVGGGSSTVLSLQNATAGSGVTYQWQSSANNSTWIDISGATSATYTATPTAATYYRCNVTCSGATGTSNSLLVNLTYCTPSATSTTYYITGVTITNGQTNFANTGTSYGLSSGYSNYTSTISCSQYATGTVNFAVALAGNSVSNTYSYGVAIWVDWNKNFVFDAGELMYNSAAYIYSASGSFTVPTGTANGDYRMRVLADYNATSPAACSVSSNNGECEDYTFTVVTQPPTLTVGTLTAFGNICVGSSSPQVAGSYYSFTLSGTSLTADATIAALSGYTYSLTPVSGYASTLTVPQSSGSIASTTIYVKFTPTAAQSYAGNISISSTGATTKTVAASGTGITVPSITTQPSTSGQTLLQNQSSGITALSVTATGTGTLSYRWFVNATGSTDTTASTFVTGATSASYTPSTTTGGTFYYFCTVTNTCGATVSSASGAIVVNVCPTPTTPVNQPTAITFSSYTDSLRVGFTAAAGADGYLVVRYPSATTTPDNPTDNTNYTAGAAFGTGGTVVYFGTASTFKDNYTITANTTYKYFVFAYNGGVCGYTAYLTTSPLSGSGTTCVSIPTASAATSIGATSFTANWTAVSGATGYLLDVSTSSTFTSFLTGYNGLSVSGGSTVSYNVTGLSTVTTYYYRVRAVNSSASCTTGNSSTITASTYQSIPWTEGFATAVVPAGWSLSGITSGGGIGVYTGIISGNTGNAIVGYLNATYASQSFITPTFANVPLNSYFSFDYRVCTNAGADLTTWSGSYKFQISKDGTT
jgi:hypothetical protein